MLSQLSNRLTKSLLGRNLKTTMLPINVNPFLVNTQYRGIKLHEYQAGALLNSYKVSIPIGEVAFNEDEAYKIAKKLKGGCVIKS